MNEEKKKEAGAGRDTRRRVCSPRKTKTWGRIMVARVILGIAVAMVLSCLAPFARAQVTVLGRTPQDIILPSFLSQNGNAATIASALGLVGVLTNNYAGTV